MIRMKKNIEYNNNIFEDLIIELLGDYNDDNKINLSSQYIYHLKKVKCYYTEYITKNDIEEYINNNIYIHNNEPGNNLEIINFDIYIDNVNELYDITKENNKTIYKPNALFLNKIIKEIESYEIL